MFVDANVLLRMYETLDGRWTSVSDRLHELEGAVLLTIQVANEVERNKLRVVRRVLDQTLRNLKPPSLALPPGFESHKEAAKTAHSALSGLHEAAKRTASALLKQVASSEDSVSKSLAILTKESAAPTNEQLARARTRKELGNPPGKPEDPLGDQVSWEQLLDLVGPETKVVWIVSTDGDFFESDFAKGPPTLNAMLLRELRSRAPNAEIRVQPDLGKAANEGLEAVGHAERKLREDELSSLLDDGLDFGAHGRCIRDGQPTSIESVACAKCGEDCDRGIGIGEEEYFVEPTQDGLKLSIAGGEFERCECGSSVFEIEFARVCSYCRQVGR
jgi:hypothetical protein